MDKDILKMLRAYKADEISEQDFLLEINSLQEKSSIDIGFANLDLDRAQRQGFAEVVYCTGKTSEQIAQIMLRLSKHSENVLATRATVENFQAVANVLPKAKYDPVARAITLEGNVTVTYPDKKILVITAGTSDIPVAEEAAITARIMGNNVETLYDVGVAGIHRLIERLPQIQNANVIIVIAGMEGALASVVGGLVNKPVIAVPTSVGYGASFHGLAALLGMLNSCSAGIAVVNIDNGFGAGRLASIINNL